MAKKLHEREEDEDSKMMWSKIFLDWRVGERVQEETLGSWKVRCGVFGVTRVPKSSRAGKKTWKVQIMSDRQPMKQINKKECRTRGICDLSAMAFS